MSRSTCRQLLRLIAVLATCALARSATAQPSEVDRITLVKAGMIMNFVKYTEWPAAAFADDASPVVITVLGRSNLAEVLEKAADGQIANGRAVKIRQMLFPAPEAGESRVSEDRMNEFYRQLRKTHALFIDSSERDRFIAELNAVNGTDVLTISDVPDFALSGGMLGLTVRGGHVTFDANTDVIRKTNLKISSKVLRLARIVKTRED